jgi:hypothetical protein
VKKLEAFASANKETQGKFTIGDEKKHNVFMRLEVSPDDWWTSGGGMIMLTISRIPRCKSSRAKQNVSR